MSRPSLPLLLVALGKTGLPELVISAFIFRFARVQHSVALVILGAFLLWPGLIHLYAFWFRRRKDD